METFFEALDNPAVHIITIAVVFYILHRLMRHIIHKVVQRVVKSHKQQSQASERKREETLESIFNTASAIVLWVIGVILVLASLKVDIAALLTGAGLIGVVVGFGAQNAIKDVLAGIFIIAEDQYRVGDIVTLADKSGVVEAVTIRITRLRDLDGHVHIIPNGETKTITNMTYTFANVNLNVGVSYDSDIKKVTACIDAVGQEMFEEPEWADMIIEPIAFLRVDSFDDSAITVKALGKVEPATQWDVAGEFRRRLKLAFDKENITIPFPQRVVHMEPAAKPAHSKK